MLGEGFLLFSGCLAGVVIAAGTACSMYFRNNPIIKTTIPIVNIPVGLTYMLFAIYVTMQSVLGTIPCPVYLWVPLILASWLGNAYVMKCWRLYVLTTVARLQKLEDANFKLVRPGGEGVEDDLLTPKSVRVSRVDDWIYRNPQVGSIPYVLKVVVVVTVIFMIFPVILTIAIPEYHDSGAQCEDRTTAEVVIYLLLMIFYVGVFSVTLFKLRNQNDIYGLKTQLKGVIIAWSLLAVVLGFLYIFVWASGGHPTMRFIFSLFNNVLYLMPFYADTLWPLWKAYRTRNTLLSKEYREIKVSLEDVLTWKDSNDKEVGWNMIASFVSEHASPVDVANNQILVHGLYFAREYINTRRDLTENSVTPLSDDEMDKNLLALVMVCWIKYLHLKGEYTWIHDADAPLLILMQQITPIKAKLEETLKTVATAESPPEDQEKMAGSLLREIYAKVIKEIEESVYQTFRESVQFENFVRLFANSKS